MLYPTELRGRVLLRFRECWPQGQRIAVAPAAVCAVVCSSCVEARREIISAPVLPPHGRRAHVAQWLTHALVAGVGAVNRVVASPQVAAVLLQTPVSKLACWMRVSSLHTCEPLVQNPEPSYFEPPASQLHVHAAW